MKIAIVFDSKFGNTRTVSEFFAEKMKASGHEVEVFRTKESKPKEVLAFQPEAMLVGGPTHFGKPARTLRKYIRKLGKIGLGIPLRKVAVFNCYTEDNVCKTIQNELLEAFPQVEVFEQSLPVQVTSNADNWKEIALPENWKEEVSNFVSAYLTALA